MNTLSALPTTPDTAASLLHRWFDHAPDAAVTVRLWDGQRVSFGVAPDVTLTVKDPDTFARAFVSGDAGAFADAYVEGRIEIEGPIAQALATVFVRQGAGSARTPDHRTASVRYDLPSDFFRLFLDERLVYSCAYFDSSDETLEAAQERKLDLICRKLDLNASDRLLDLGCGWGSLAIWAATHYGSRVHGVTLSDAQADEACRRVSEAGVAELVTIGVADYRDLPAQTFTKVASVGMSQHVGAVNIQTFLNAIRRSVLPGGLFVNHSMAHPDANDERSQDHAIVRWAFPGGALLPVHRIQAHLEAAGFEVLDVHGLRPHYVLTLAEWSRRLERHRAEAVSHASEADVRRWEVYLAACAHAFETGHLSVYQVLSGVPDDCGHVRMPLRRRV